MFHAVAAVEAVLLVDDAGRAQGDGPLGAGLHTGAAADAGLGNGVALGLCTHCQTPRKEKSYRCYRQNDFDSNLLHAFHRGNLESR